jgi:putative oxidoreductase
MPVERRRPSSSPIFSAIMRQSLACLRLTARRGMLNNAAGMRRHTQTSENRKNRGRRDWLRWAALCARIALGAAFLSGIADRFGLYRGRNVGYGDFAGFVRYTAKVNSFMPASTIPFLAWAATIAELFFGITLILGIWRVWVALGSAVLLILFGTAMAISFGIKSPLDYSVFSASSAALLVAAYESRRKEWK